MDIIFATSNTHKIIEAKEALGKSFNIITPKDLGIIEEIPETGNTLKDNACQKAMYLWNKTHKTCLADDTGLEVDILDGEPGVYTARYYLLPDTYSNSPLSNLSAKVSLNVPMENMKKLLRELDARERILKDKANRNAQFKTVIALIIDGQTICFEGILKGKIARELSGSEGFGYDPIFIPQNYNCTLAQISLEQKNSISHRGKALREFANYINSVIP